QPLRRAGDGQCRRTLARKLGGRAKGHLRDLRRPETPDRVRHHSLLEPCLGATVVRHLPRGCRIATMWLNDRVRRLVRMVFPSYQLLRVYHFDTERLVFEPPKDVVLAPIPDSQTVNTSGVDEVIRA